MRPKHAITAINAALDVCQPVMLWGSPGIGKSDIVRFVREQRGLDRLIDLRLSQIDPVDLRGVPSIVNGRTVFCPPDFLPTEGTGIIFLDEINSAAQLTQAAGYELVQDRKIGNYRLPDGWFVVAAGNRESDKAIVNKMATPLCNRFAHIDLEVNLDDWVEWALGAGISTEVIAFLRYRANLLNAFDPQSNAKAFPTPRSWAFLDRLYKRRLPAEVEYELYSGTVGAGAAGEFLSFIRVFRSLPNPDRIIMDPNSVDVPEDNATLYALCGALTARVSDNTFANIAAFSDRMPPEFSVLLIRDCLQACPDVGATRAFVQWAANHKNVVL